VTQKLLEEVSGLQSPMCSHGGRNGSSICLLPAYKLYGVQSVQHTGTCNLSIGRGVGYAADKNILWHADLGAKVVRRL